MSRIDSYQVRRKELQNLLVRALVGYEGMKLAGCKTLCALRGQYPGAYLPIRSVARHHGAVRSTERERS